MRCYMRGGLSVCVSRAVFPRTQYIAHCRPVASGGSVAWHRVDPLPAPSLLIGAELSPFPEPDSFRSFIPTVSSPSVGGAEVGPMSSLVFGSTQFTPKDAEGIR